ncbi:hypothetical protein D6D20_09734 [Aureobasidium pullulans]|uniref:Uncharacterized protein n=1 Tax=Aureobasidium pullulans TaxID=5580 RepID=A0A4S8YW50_AURPU|nr:hypothetical protein D6D20_09734 [Aureobasidium pullulans]
MSATNTMALLGYISFLSSSPIVTLATPSLASQENNSDLDDDDDSDDIIPDLADISSASSKDTFPCIIRHQSCSFFAKEHTASPPYTNSIDDFLHDPQQGSCAPASSLLCYLWQPRRGLCHHSFAHPSQQPRRRSLIQFPQQPLHPVRPRTSRF